MQGLHVRETKVLRCSFTTSFFNCIINIKHQGILDWRAFPGSNQMYSFLSSAVASHRGDLSDLAIHLGNSPRRNGKRHQFLHVKQSWFYLFDWCISRNLDDCSGSSQRWFIMDFRSWIPYILIFASCFCKWYSPPSLQEVADYVATVE